MCASLTHSRSSSRVSLKISCLSQGVSECSSSSLPSCINSFRSRDPQSRTTRSRRRPPSPGTTLARFPRLVPPAECRTVLFPGLDFRSVTANCATSSRFHHGGRRRLRVSAGVDAAERHVPGGRHGRHRRALRHVPRRFRQGKSRHTFFLSYFVDRTIVTS